MVSLGADPSFRKALEALPDELLQGLRDAALDDAGILENYPRDTYADLLAAGVTGASTAVTDGMVTTADMDVDMDGVLDVGGGAVRVLASITLSLLSITYFPSFTYLPPCLDSWVSLCHSSVGALSDGGNALVFFM